MTIYFPLSKSYTNPISGVKIIARLINASKTGELNEEDDDIDEDEDDE